MFLIFIIFFLISFQFLVFIGINKSISFIISYLFIYLLSS